MDMEQAKQLFINEAEELLDVMESCLLEVEDGSVTIEQHIDAIFRAAHTIKGSAGLFGFDSIVAFTHAVESVLDRVRDGKCAFENTLADLMLECHRHMHQLIQALSDSELLPDTQVGIALINQLELYLNPNARTDSTEVEPEPLPEELPDPRCWLINIDYGEEVFRDGMDPISQLCFLQTMGSLPKVTLQPRFPAQDFDPESCYLSVRAEFETVASKQQIEEAFEFIQDNSRIRIGSPATLADKIKASPQVDQRLGDVLMEAGAVTQRELDLALKVQRDAQQNNQIAEPLGTLLVRQGVVAKSVVESAANIQKSTEYKRPAEFQYLKVESRKLDKLISLVGELVTSGAANELLIAQLENEELTDSFASMVNLVEQIRDSALDLRMVQVGESFGRLKRIVRDVSKELNKDVHLDIMGSETELDKSMVEKLSDPLMHIVRNALDHGIEAKEIRQYKGKPEIGTLKLNAYHESGAVVIEISDDGAGLNVEKVRAKAIERGLISEDKQLSQEEIFKLIFEPGFSTSAAVTNLSGRGVGMDVVKRNIEELRGQITIESASDKGTRFRIRLPLTLAIIDGFRVRVGDTHFVIPVNMIQECVEFESASLAEDRDYINLRDEVLPFVSVRKILGVSGAEGGREHVVVVQFGNSRAGLIVDELFGELQAVIKPLSGMFRAIRGIGGSTILGSGDVGFILDVPQLIEFASQNESKRCEPVRMRQEKIKHE